MRRAMVVLLVVAGAGAVGTGCGAAAAAPRGADGWDPRIVPIARKVEKLRRLRFKHPVRTEFLTVAKFRTRVTADEDTITRKDRREIRTGEAELRALGLVDGSFDLFATVNEVSGSGVLAYYDPEKSRIVVRGQRLDAEARVTLAHELTHALQDQHYNMEKLRSRTKTAGADDAVVALIEGDATRIESEYYFDLSNRDQRAVDKAEGFAGNANDPVPGPEMDSDAASAGIVGALFQAPYAFGPQMVDVILAVGNRRGLDRAFRHPPITQLQYLFPTQALHRGIPVPLRRPKLASGSRRLVADQPDDFGAADLYFMLASRLPSSISLRAADAWGNGKELISRSDGRTCVDLVFAGRNRAGGQRLGRTIRLWAASMPTGDVTVSRDGLTIRGCDPGTGVDGPPNSAEDALLFAAIRNTFVSDIVNEGAPVPLAACIGDRIIERPEFAGLVATAEEQRAPTEDEIAAVGSVLETLIPGCD